MPTSKVTPLTRVERQVIGHGAHRQRRGSVDVQVLRRRAEDEVIAERQRQRQARGVAGARDLLGVDLAARPVEAELGRLVDEAVEQAGGDARR